MNMESVKDFASISHRGQKYGSQPYFYHLEGVVKILELQELSEDYAVVGWLHDVLEDTDATVLELQYLGLSEVQINAIIAITRMTGESYVEYMAKVQGNEIASKVKLADALFNLSECIKTNQLKRAKKYNKVIQILLDAI